MTDREITILIRDGQLEKAFNELVASYSERLYWHVRGFVCSHEDTDDLLQEIFMKAWAALPTFRGDSKPFTWLYRIATNETLNFLQKMRVRSALRFTSLDSEMAERIDADPFFDGDEAQRILSKAIQKLPSKQKSVFIMRYYDELPYEDISEILGTSEGALKASYHFAREKIISEIEKETGKKIKPDSKLIVKEPND